MSGHVSDPSPRGDTAPWTLTALAALLRSVPPSLGPVRLVAVDGHAGSGKSTFAARLADELSAPVLHLDDVASHDALFDWTERLREQVLTPLSRGRTARPPVYDWVRRQYGPQVAEVPPAPVVLLDGVGAGRRALRPSLACLLWMDMPQQRAAAHGLRRDGPELTGFWDIWTRAERAHFDDDPSSPHANFLVSRGNEGYTVRTGPVRLP